MGFGLVGLLMLKGVDMLLRQVVKKNSIMKRRYGRQAHVMPTLFELDL